MISEMFLYNENDRSSVLLHPQIDRASVKLYLKAKEKGRDISPYLVRQSFLLSTIEWNLIEAIKFGRGLIPQEPIPETDKDKDGNIVNSSGIVGRDIYPLFAMTNTIISTSHIAMNYSIKLIATVCEARNWNTSIHWANEKGQKDLKKHTGKEISELVTKAWEWASEIKDYRDLMEHFNPLYSQPVVMFTSTNGKNYDGFKFFLPKNPEDRQTRGEGQVWGKEAISYCINTFERVINYNQALIPLLISKY